MMVKGGRGEEELGKLLEARDEWLEEIEVKRS